MHVLLVGSGGREDALAWALARSPELERLCCAPGSAGIARRGVESVPIDPQDVERLTAHAREVAYDLVVIGPEAPLGAGLADRLEAAGVAVFGPAAAAARLETSKAFAKRFMQRHDIPTAAFEIFDEPDEARAWLGSSAARYPLVLKADGLAAGKGVLLADGREAALAALDELMVARRFGAAGARVVIEELLVGREASFFVLADGERFVELASCQDYKRAYDGDRGPNTGGMGAYSPSVHVSERERRTIVETIVQPTIAGMRAEGTPYRGVLYVGVMLTERGPRVLEYNARFGDPETQVLVPRLSDDWLGLLNACATGQLGSRVPRFGANAAVCVVMSARDYPAGGDRGSPIAGLARAEALEGVEVFHAGTERDAAGTWRTCGGRVLGVTACGADLAAARARAYEAVESIAWDGERHRADIALDALREIATRSQA